MEVGRRSDILSNLIVTVTEKIVYS